MSPTEFDIGGEVACADGACGVLSRVVVNPVTQELTHLVVEPRHRQAKGHLVPIRFATSSGDHIQLSCTKAQLEEFEPAVEAQYLPASRDVVGYRPQDVLMEPYWSVMTRPEVLPLMSGAFHPRSRSGASVPIGEVDIRRGEPVHATDGDIGRVAGLAINPDDHHVTHILLEEGHLFGQKRVAIPISAVTRVGEVIKLTLSKEEVRGLPAVDVHHPLG
jgi:sporulation protein YlmC with PRC-barrel domain